MEVCPGKWQQTETDETLRKKRQMSRSLDIQYIRHKWQPKRKHREAKLQVN